MRKYLVILAMVLGLAFVVARHDEYALKSAQEPTDKNKPTIIGIPNENHLQEHPKNSAWDSPSGHIFHSAFRWPEGTTVWAILLTLFAIAEQTGQTRVAAEAARDSTNALISSERAWILASITRPVQPHTFFRYELKFTNYGPTPAKLQSFSWETKMAYPIGELPANPNYGTMNEIQRLLAPGDTWTVGVVFPTEDIDAADELLRFRNAFAICIGYVKYGGIFEGIRTTKFCFGFNHTVDEFTPMGPIAYNDAD